RPGERLAGAFEEVQRIARRPSDVEAVTGAAQVTVAVPADVALHLVRGIEATALDQALGEAQRHRRVVGPVSCRQAEWSAAAHAGERLKCAGRHELDRGAQCVADGEAKKGAGGAVCYG